MGFLTLPIGINHKTTAGGGTPVTPTSFNYYRFVFRAYDPSPDVNIIDIVRVYFDNVVPLANSATSNVGNYTGSAQFAPINAWRDDNNRFISQENATPPIHLTGYFATARAKPSFVRCQAFSGVRDPEDWKLEASVDNTTYYTLVDVVGVKVSTGASVTA